jgi:hypothetical protein
VKTKDLRVSEDALVLPVQDGRQIAIPVHISATDPSAASMFQIPWFGGPRWQGMYDFPNHQRTRQHISVIALWDAHDTKRKIIKNNANADVALTQMREILGIKAPATTRSSDDAADAHAAEIQRVLTEAKPLLDEFNKLKPQEIDNDGRLFLQRIDALRSVRDEGAKLAAQLTEQRKHLAQQLGGKSVLLGWIATGRTRRVTPHHTFDTTCPCVVAHGVNFNPSITRVLKRMPTGVTIRLHPESGFSPRAPASWMRLKHNFVARGCWRGYAWSSTLVAL